LKQIVDYTTVFKNPTPGPSTLNPKPYTLHPKPQTLRQAMLEQELRVIFRVRKHLGHPFHDFIPPFLGLVFKQPVGEEGAQGKN